MLDFRRLGPAEEDAGYAVLVDSVAWQRSKSIRLWDRPLPRDIYARRHALGQNFGLFETPPVAASAPVAVVSLITGIPEIWRAELTDTAAPWLATLAVAGASHGRGLGHESVEHACAHLAAEGHRAVYLDCAIGFLEAFYAAHAFHPLARGQLCGAPGACAVPAVLMRRELGAG